MIHIHTLGPAGTNCEKAAIEYLGRFDGAGCIHLHRTLEDAVDEMMRKADESVLLGCVVYPKLHEIVFRNLGRLRITDCFVVDTYEMVFASTKPRLADIRTVGTHPAPENLVVLMEGLRDVEVVHCDSNAAAARLCAAGRYDACVTTLAAAREHGIGVHRSFGPVPMGFSIHAKEARS